MYVFDNKHECSGCTACKHSCPYNAITMMRDNEGFEYPVIDTEKCIKCGLCQKVCPFNQNYYTDNNFDIPLVFAAKHKDEIIRISSSSGGVFSALSNYVLDNGGIIYGAAFDDDFKVRHIKVDNMLDIRKLKGSKYVQSKLDGIFLDVKEEIKNDRYILFTGTPCQTAGLKAFLRNKDYDKLILVDLVCAGVPSPLIWESYINLLQEKNQSKLKYYSFRNKRTGWHNSCSYAEFEDGKNLHNNPLLDSYRSIFSAHMGSRPSCHYCVFTNFNRPSDITIGDFWGIEKHKPEFDDDKGVSVILINTEKGKTVFNEISKELEYKTSNIEEAKQRNLTMPTKPSPKREQFWIDFNKGGYEFVAKKYTEYGIKNRIKKRIAKPILKKIRTKISK